LKLVLPIIGLLVSGVCHAQASSSVALVEQFNSATISWKQFEVAKQIVQLQDRSVLQALESHLGDEDRHSRGNAAFVFAALGDDRGFDVITTILNDRSSRPMTRRAVPIAGIGIVTLEEVIAEDRYYAVFLLGQLKDPRAGPLLLPLLKDREVGIGVPWALGAIGYKPAIRPLIEILGESSDTNMLAVTIYALGKLDAKEALPAIRSVGDDAQAHFYLPGYDLVAKAAATAIARLEMPMNASSESR
jgi:HEAT repeat protein